MKFSELKLPSNRRFGLFFSFVFVLLFLFFYENTIDLLHLFLLFSSLSLIIISFVKPNILLPFNKAWMFSGFVLGKVISPFVLGSIFFILITPVALLTKIFGRDELMLKKNNSKTFWKTRASNINYKSFFENQF